MPRFVNQFQTIRSEGAILPPDLLQKVAAGEVEGLAPDAYHLPPGVKLKEAISQSWTRLQAHWREFRKICATLGDEETGTLATREKWLLPLLNELGYGRLPASKAPEIDGKTYAIDRFYNHVPIHLIGFRLPLDRRTKGARGAATASPHSLLQEYLNRSETSVWGILSNGLQLRILRDSKALSRQSFVEFDLESMFEGEIYADFAILWMVAHQSRVESDKAADCWLEKWSKLSHEQGTRILSALRIGVTKAIEILGRGFVGHPRNEHLRDRLRKGELGTQDFYRQLLRTVYRLLFLFVAEDRKLLHPPGAAAEACDTFDRFYSTRRLRDLSERMRGSKHADLWHALAFVFDKLNRPDGCRELGLPAFGSFLWSPAAVPDLAGPAPKGAEPVPNPVLISNEELLSAVRAIAFTEDNRVLRAVDYGNMGSEELGSVYESLLELHPQVIAGNTADSSSFELRTAAGNERKTSGSYYTPDSLVQCLLDSALEPVVADTLERARKGPDGKPFTGDALRESQEKALLALKVCDPACGSGHFLIAAAHRIGAHLARVRGGEVEPSPADYQHAVRDVISHCIYGVDINPMAVELCKVALWMEALEPGKPLSFLDHRIQCGNSLLGVTPALLAKGIPDEAFEPIEGDDKAVCRELKRRNKDERKGQGQLWDAAGRPWERLGNLATAMVALDSVPDDTIAGVQDKQRRWQELVQSSGYLSGRLLADAWCAAFVWKKTREMGDAITESVFRRIERNPHDLTPWMRHEIRRLCEQYQFLHWHLAFPDVFRVPRPEEAADNEQTGWNGGFDVVLGNPPWERIKLQEKEWFGQRRPEIANAASAALRRRMIEGLRSEDPSLYSAFIDERRRSEGEVSLVREASRYPLCGRGDINTYAVFAELNKSLCGAFARVGCIVPTGIATDDTTRFFFKAMTQRGMLASLYDLENALGVFPGVHRSYKFCLLTLRAESVNTTRRATQRADQDDAGEPAEFAFFLHSVDQLKDAGRCFRLTASVIDRLNPESGTVPVLRSEQDLLLLLKLYDCSVAIEGDDWGGFYIRLIHLADHAEAVRLELPDDLGAQEWLPVYEAKLFHHYDHRFASFENVDSAARAQGQACAVEEISHADPLFDSAPRYWVQRSFFDSIIGRYPEAQHWLLGYRDIARSTDERTCICTTLPRVATTVSVPCVGVRQAQVKYALLANMSSFVFDFAVRQKVSGTHLSWGVFKQSPFLSPALYSRRAGFCEYQPLSEWLRSRVCELSYTAWSLRALSKELSCDCPPFRWNEVRRTDIRCELDAAFFHLYLGTAQEWRQSGSPELLRYFPTPRDAVEHIMETFPIVKRKDEAKHGSYRTKEMILSIYDEMADVIAANEVAVAAGRQPTAAYETRLDPPPGPPADAAGNFLPLPVWKPGQPRPANWPRHIHAPREVHEWALANGIDWRELLDGPPGVLPKPTREPGAAPAARPAPVAARTGDAGVLPGFESAVAAITSESKRREREKELVLQAFRDVRDGRSPDYVIAAPDLNPLFLTRARELGVERPDVEVNLMLYGARKASKLKDDPTTKEYRLPRQVLPFVFASEWAIRHLQRELLTAANHEPSLDDILCNPELASRFDAVAARIKPGFSPLEYRWAALGLRKTGRQTAGELSIGFPLNQQLPLFDLDPRDVPETPSLYLIQAEDKPLYVNATDNLRAQILRHRDCAGQTLVPDWLSAARGTPTRISFAALYGADVKRLKEARIRQVADLQPWLNLLDLPGAA